MRLEKNLVVNGGFTMIECKHKLFPELTFANEIEKQTFYDYLGFKGLFLHKHVYEAFLLYKDSLTYKELSSYIRYDKGLRNVLYRNLSAVEEYYRARLLNKYDIKNPIQDPISISVGKNVLIDSNEETSNLYNFTFSKKFTFNKLIDLLKSKNLITQKEEEALKQIRIFRNKVMHHNLIIIAYHSTKEKIENEIKEIESFCELIYQYLPSPMKNAFEGNINKCNHLTNRNRTPNLEILCLKEMKDGLFR